MIMKTINTEIPTIKKSNLLVEATPAMSGCCTPRATKEEACCVPSEKPEDNDGACCAQPDDGTACCDK